MPKIIQQPQIKNKPNGKLLYLVLPSPEFFSYFYQWLIYCAKTLLWIGFKGKIEETLSVERVIDCYPMNWCLKDDI